MTSWSWDRALPCALCSVEILLKIFCPFAPPHCVLSLSLFLKAWLLDSILGLRLLAQETHYKPTLYCFWFCLCYQCNYKARLQKSCSCFEPKSSIWAQKLLQKHQDRKAVLPPSTSLFGPARQVYRQKAYSQRKRMGCLIKKSLSKSRLSLCFLPKELW